ncbi:MAG: hypothetical protein AAFU41_10940 [Pseudomonadota bacterium]
MNEIPETDETEAQLAENRLAEVDALSRRIRRALTDMMDTLEGDDEASALPKTILTKLNELHAAHLKVLAAEDTFHDKIGKDPDADAADLDSIRAEIGRQLDRIRETLVAKGVSIAPDAGTDDGTALFVRFLGAAASDPTRG